jgi:bifunctional UDP-N-acetylglucosamine pyrophosphorylase/glucosamine-1-phosphate N-acetyltransferase
MKSDLPKVLHPLCGRPILSYVLDLARDLKIKNRVVVLGHKQTEVRKILGPGIKIAIQKKLLGSADALKSGLNSLKNFKGSVLILYADVPLLKKETIAKLLNFHLENKLDATILTGQLDRPEGYGRILRDKCSNISGIIEEEDADDFQKEIKEVNTGIVCFDKEALVSALNKVQLNKRKKEYYLTDTVSILYKQGRLIDGLKIADMNEALGINSRIGLSKANRIMQLRLNEELMKNGVSIIDPQATFIDYGVKIGKDTQIYPFTVIEKDVKIGSHCSVGPFAHLRGRVQLEDDVVVGNFIEIVRSKLSSNTFAKHFGYIGDSYIGRRVNIGAGTVVANFDGRKKNTTVIRDGAFVGSDTVLVAPVKVGKNSKTGAGSVVVKSVKDNTTVVGVPARPIKRNINSK